MKKFVYVLILVAISAVFGAIYLSQDDSANTASTEQLSAETESNSQPRLPEQALSGSFIVTVTYRNPSDPSQDGELRFDYISSTKYAVSGSVGGEQSDIIVSDNYTYILNEGQWIRTSTPGDSLEIDDFNVSDAEYAQLKDAAEYQGEESCDGGQTCDVWIGDVEGDQAKLYVSKQSGRIVRVEATPQSGEEITARYDYDTQPKVDVPTNYTEVDGLSQ